MDHPVANPIQNAIRYLYLDTGSHVDDPREQLIPSTNANTSTNGIYNWSLTVADSDDAHSAVIVALYGSRTYVVRASAASGWIFTPSRMNAGPFIRSGETLYQLSDTESLTIGSEMVAGSLPIRGKGGIWVSSAAFKSLSAFETNSLSQGFSFTDSPITRVGLYERTTNNIKSVRVQSIDFKSSATKRVDAIISAIQNAGVLIPDLEDARRYFNENPISFDALSGIARKTREHFPADVADISLEIYHDPEFPDEYPTLYVRKDQYDNSIMDEIDHLERECGSLLAQAGRLLITTDFRKRK